MKKGVFKVIAIALTAVLAINNFGINKKFASAAEIDFAEIEGIENFDRQLIYEHGLIERVYLENTADSYYGTNSKNVDLTFELCVPHTTITLAKNEMHTAWAYGRAVPTYPYLAYYTNTPYAIDASSITYKDSNTEQKKVNNLYGRSYKANFSYVYQGKTNDWSCGLVFLSNGNYYILE